MNEINQLAQVPTEEVYSEDREAIMAEINREEAVKTNQIPVGGGTTAFLTTKEVKDKIKQSKEAGYETITDFDDGIEGQSFTFIAAHTVTITDGTNILLNGSANWTMTVSDTLTLIQQSDGKWIEVSRGDNGA